MRKRKVKPDIISQKLLRGIKLGRQKMLEEKSLKGQYVVYYENGKIIEESASDILKREKRNK